jgi:hypothetical protein
LEKSSQVDFLAFIGPDFSAQAIFNHLMKVKTLHKSNNSYQTFDNQKFRSFEI